MTDSFRRSPPTDSESLQLQMERCIDQLGLRARSGIEPALFLREVLESALHPGGASRAILWRLGQEGRWQVVGDLPGPETLSPQEVEQRQPILCDVARSLPTQPQPIPKPSVVPGWLTPILSSGQVVAILESLQPATSGKSSASTVPFLAALAEITADFLTQIEIQQLRQARTNWQLWDQYSQRLGQFLDLETVCSVIANDGVRLVDGDRVSVLVRRGRGYVLKSISGVDRIEPRSTATRSLESLALLVASEGHSVWKHTDEEEPNPPLDGRLQETLSQHMRDSGATSLGIVPILTRESERTPSSPVGVIVIEQFRPVSDHAGWESRAEALANRSRSNLLSACERDDIPWLGIWQRLRSGPSSISRRKTGIVLAALAGLIAALVLIPAEFTVSGPATLWPALRREVFASDTAIIDQILVSHGDTVTANQPLIVLRSPELEAESPRILGEIATVSERLKGVQAARLTGGNTPDAAARSRQLTVDEEELKERLRTLELQRDELEQRKSALTLRSPIAGQVLTWDVAQQLSARPVERGQSLLTIGETSGPWVVEVQVADKEIGHLLRAQQALKPDLDVEFLLAADPGKVCHGTIKSRSTTALLDDDARSRVRVIVAFDRNQIDQPRPGATALPRIHCGKRSLGYVWLHDLIDAIRTRLLF
ncbi:MAG: HlyD family efflux transporter periplasmic adaptor subunit [Planctomycetaceae bacterium]